MQKPLRCSSELSRLDQNGMYIATSVRKKDRQLGSKELKVHFFVEVRFLAPSGKKGRKRKRPFCVCSSSPSYSYSSLSSLVGRTLAEPPPPPLMETCGSPLCPPNPSFLLPWPGGGSYANVAAALLQPWGKEPREWRSLFSVPVEEGQDSGGRTVTPYVCKNEPMIE